MPLASSSASPDPPTVPAPSATGAHDSAPSPHAPPAGDTDPGDRPGHQVVLGLFLVLALSVIFVFSVFAAAVRPEDREWVPELTARYLYMPVVATGLLIATDAYRLGWRRWWVFVIMAPVPGVNVVLAALWLMKWRIAASRGV